MDEAIYKEHRGALIHRGDHALDRGAFICQSGGTVDVKGKGPMPVWFVEGRRPT